MDIPRVLEEMGLGVQDYGPTVDTYANFAKNNRFKVDVPSEADMVAVWLAIQGEDIATAYVELRKAEYPDIGDQLDSIWKQFNQDRLDGKAMIQEVDDRLGEILAIKAKYPKA